MKIKINHTCLQCYIKYLLLSFFFLSIACSSNKPINPIEFNLSQETRPILMPFKIEILEEFNDGKYIYVKIDFKNNANYKITNVVLKAIGLNKGKEVSSQYFLMENLINSNEGVFVIEIPAPDITDYLIELLWGKEAEGFLNIEKQKLLDLVSISNLKVEKIRECANYICKIYYNIIGKINNNNDIGISQVDFLVGFLSASEMKENKQSDITNLRFSKTVPVNNLNLPPKSNREFNIKIDSPENDEDSVLQPIVLINRP